MQSEQSILKSSNKSLKCSEEGTKIIYRGDSTKFTIKKNVKKKKDHIKTTRRGINVDQQSLQRQNTILTPIYIENHKDIQCMRKYIEVSLQMKKRAAVSAHPNIC
jgi:uncharacterized protein YaaN involved in tellurite resistance